MMCAWNELLSILPPRMRQEIDGIGKNGLCEIRLRINAPPELILPFRIHWLADTVTSNDLNYVINTAIQYSPWSVSSLSHGYITASGGHRIGVCGEIVNREGMVDGMREIESVCIRVAMDFPDIGSKALGEKGSILILGAPGWGKTTLLRDVIRQIAQKDTVCVVDERKELFPVGVKRGKRMDVLSGCPKILGIQRVLRTMSPECIAVDEITAEEDSQAVIKVSNCGVRILATAHAASMQDYLTKEIYRPLIDKKIFQTVFLLRRNKTYSVERMKLWDTNG